MNGICSSILRLIMETIDRFFNPPQESFSTNSLLGTGRKCGIVSVYEGQELE